MTAKLREIRAHRTSCSRCGRKIVFGLTVASDTGHGGKSMPLDPVEAPDGNVAVTIRPTATGRILVRPLKKDEAPIDGMEMRAMPHFATCSPPAPLPEDLPSNVIDFAARRRLKGSRHARP